jgi:GH25 family lysozyme M1 (1,4-beta-N-acetylmuramidase)
MFSHTALLNKVEITGRALGQYHFTQAASPAVPEARNTFEAQSGVISIVAFPCKKKRE